MSVDLILHNLRIATMVPSGDDPFGLVDDAVVAIESGKILYAGPASGFEGKTNGARVISMNGKLALPGFVCCHNSMLWMPGGDVPKEMDGAGYRDLVEQTAESTAIASDEDLLDIARQRIARLTRSGVTACELKTGFGRTPDEELRLAMLARQLQQESALLSTVTLYAGHFMPKGRDPDDHMEAIVTKLLPQIYERSACDAVEVFCDDDGGLDLDQASTILEAFYRKKTPSRVSCDRFSDSAGATLPASFYSRSATYLCQSDEDGIQSVAAMGTAMILVPEIALRDAGSRRPDLESIRETGGRVALCSEGGPDGSGLSLLSVARLGVNCFQLTPEEALAGITVHAARALGLSEQVGTIEGGKRGDLVLFEADSAGDLIQQSEVRPSAVVTAGELSEFS
ncbi:imidazolonepropionase [Aminobacter lissarensis]|uniref:imidazolonepropionase n=1 Tax=Aminobacter carboxidus TaxID=376165 RepID=A0A8E1WK57_9HYPH|nr:amidohydrolase family protein [Aminobacter lissarensis]MBB6469379.1 imidazolonepropionase [Aminobacter lissarensis]